MDFASKLVGFAITLAVTLAAAGQLPRPTLWLIQQMPDNGSQLISLGKLNRALHGKVPSRNRHVNGSHK